MSVSPEEFVKAWQAGVSVRAIARALGMTEGAVSQRAYHYRRLGVQLKRFPLGRNHIAIDVPALKKLAKSLAPRDMEVTS